MCPCVLLWQAPTNGLLLQVLTKAHSKTTVAVLKTKPTWRWMHIRGPHDVVCKFRGLHDVIYKFRGLHYVVCKFRGPHDAVCKFRGSLKCWGLFSPSFPSMVQNTAQASPFALKRWKLFFQPLILEEWITLWGHLWWMHYETMETRADGKLIFKILCFEGPSNRPPLRSEGRNVHLPVPNRPQPPSPGEEEVIQLFLFCLPFF